MSRWGRRSRAGAAPVRGILAAAVLLAGLFTATSAPVRAETGGATYLDIWATSSANIVAGAAFQVEVSSANSTTDWLPYFSDGVHFTSSDPLAILPADYTYKWGTVPPGDDGWHVFSITLKTAGSQTITVTDVSHASITGTLTVYVQPGPVAHLSESVPAATTAGAVAYGYLFVTDAYGNQIQNYTGTVHFSSTDSAATLPPDYTFGASNQGWTYLNVTFRTPGNQSITVADLAHPALTDTRWTTVTAAPHLVIHLYPTVSAGQSGNFYEVQAVDASGTVNTGYLGTIRFYTSDTHADKPADYVFQAGDHGDAFIAGLTFKTAGRQTVSVYDVSNGLIWGSDTTTVTPGPTTAVVLTGMPSTIVAGSQISLGVTLYDGYGNVKTNYVGGDVHFTSTDPLAVLPSVYQFVAGDGGSHMFTVTLKTAGARTVSVIAGSFSNSEGTSVMPAGTTRLAFSPVALPWTAGASHSFTVGATDTYGNPTPAYHGTVHFTCTDAAATLPADAALTNGVGTFGATLRTVGSQSITATDIANSSITGTQSGIVVTASSATHFGLSGLPNPTVAGVAHSMTVNALDAFGNTATAYVGTVHFSSTDPAASLPSDYTFVSGDAGTHTFSVTLNTVGTRSVTATDTVTGAITGAQTGIVVQVAPISGATYHALTPTRILDSRDHTGGLGVFSSHVAQSFTVTGHGGVPSNAIAVTGNLTVTQQTSAGFLSIGPVAMNNPTSSTLNFPLGDDRANAVTVALGAGGTLSVTYAASTLGPTAQVIFDVTGYFTPDATGATYHALTPSRILDSRDGTGGLSGAFSSHVARTFTVTGHGGVPSGAIAVTGNLTVTQQSSGGFLFVGPNSMNNPTSSTLNFPVGDDRANSVTVALGTGGTLSVTYAAATLGPVAQVIFDVTGYFTPDMTGATYHALTPSRILDSRDHTGGLGIFSSHAAQSFGVTGQGGVAAGAIAVTGNLTVTQQTSGGFLSIGPVAQNNPTSSTLNFPLADDRANAVTVALGTAGTLSVTYAASTLGPTAQVIFDVTGYFAP